MSKNQSDKQKGFADRYNDKINFLQQWYEERVAFLSTFKLPGMTMRELEEELLNIKNGSTSSGSSSAAGTVEGNGPEEKTWNFLAQQGLSPAAIAGVMGNLKQESGIDPKKLQYGGGPGRGICQWETHPPSGGRWDALLNWAKGAGKDEWAIETQLEWMWKELGTDDISRRMTNKGCSGGFEGFKKLTDYEEACRIFEEAFERAGKPNFENRYKYAKAYFDKWGKNPPSGDVSNVKGDAKKVIDEATSWLTRPNVYWFGGGRTAAEIAAGKFDCSSWVRYVFAQCGYEVCAFGGTTQEIKNNSALQKVSASNFQPGDIIFWNTVRDYGHVGIYLGNNRALADNGDTGTGKVGYIDLNSNYWKPKLCPDGRRVKWDA
jgi:cell wall-associated NlpC family hydrolase